MLKLGVAKNLKWTFEETMAILFLGESVGWKNLSKDSPKFLEYSAMLQAQDIHPLADRKPNFRSVGSIRRKYADLQCRFPGYQGTMTSGSKMDVRVVEYRVAGGDSVIEEARDIVQAMRQNML